MHWLVDAPIGEVINDVLVNSVSSIRRLLTSYFSWALPRWRSCTLAVRTTHTVYYFNATTGISQWEPPLWLDEIDPTTGAVYYVNSYTGDPQVPLSMRSARLPPGAASVYGYCDCP